jgi:hypothetical protein
MVQAFTLAVPPSLFLSFFLSFFQSLAFEKNLYPHTRPITLTGVM